jgi:hypothetical protein
LLIDKPQFFDLDSDRHEMRDLAGEARYAGKVAELMELLRQAQQAHGDSAPLKVANPKPAAWSPPGREKH